MNRLTCPGRCDSALRGLCHINYKEESMNTSTHSTIQRSFSIFPALVLLAGRFSIKKALARSRKGIVKWRLVLYTIINSCSLHNHKIGLHNLSWPHVKKVMHQDANIEGLAMKINFSFSQIARSNLRLCAAASLLAALLARMPAKIDFTP